MTGRNIVLELLITAKDSASAVLGDIKTKALAFAAAIAGAFSTKEAANFEKALDAIRARADETGPALEALIDRAKTAAQTIGPEFGFSATQAAGGIKELIAAGFSADESIKALRGTLALAAMEEISVADAAKLISDAITQFGLKAEDASKVADILAKAAGAVAATATDMAEALKYTGNEASRSGMSLTETAATLDVLAKAGQRGSEAGTGLASVLGILGNPAHAATKALFDLGATSTELGDVLDFLDKRGINASQTIALFGEQGGRVINTLLAQGGSKAIADFAEKIGAAGKSAEETAKIMQGNFLGAMNRFWESLKRVGVELATPKLEPFAKGLDTLTAALNSFASNDRIQAFQQSLADGFAAAYNKVRAFSVDIDWGGIQNSIGGAFGAITTSVGKALDSLGSIYSSLTGTLPGAANIGRQAGELFKSAWEGVGQIAEGVAGGIERIAQALSGSVKPSAQEARTALDGVTQSAQQQATGFQALWQALKTDALDGVKRTWDSLTRGAGDLLAAINSLAQKGSELLAGFIRGADFGPVRDLFNAVADAAKRLAGTVTEGFPNAGRAAEVFASSFTVAWSGVVGILSAVVAGTTKVVEAIGRATFEVGKYFNRYSDEEIGRIEANLNNLSTSAGEFANVAARSFDASGKAIDRIRDSSGAAAQQQRALAEQAAKGADAQGKLAQATAEQAAKQTDAVEKAKQYAEAVQLQQKEVERLSLADQNAEGAKQAHAAATQKLWAMQGDFIESVKVLNGEQYASAAANDAVKATITTLNATMEEGRQKLAGYTPTLEDLRNAMEATQKELVRVEEAQKKGTLAATEDKSVTEQVNEARKRAGDALNAYNSALDRNIERAEASSKTAARQRDAQEAVARSGEALIEASLRLAEIEGDANRVAELTARRKTEQAEATKLTAARYWEEAEAAERSAQALKLKYEALAKTDPLNREAIAKAKEAADSARAEAQAVRATAIEMEAKIPVMEKEARQAEIMAGPIGQLIRLYQDKSKAADRETDAVERVYNANLRALEVEKKQAEAKGDTARAAELGIKIAQAEIEKTQAVADAKKAELQTEIDLIEAKKLELLASDQSAEAKAKELAAIDAKIAKLKDLQNAEQARADIAKAEAETAKRAAEATKAQATAAADAERETRRMASVIGYAAKSFGDLSEQGQKALQAINTDAMARASKDGASLTRAILQLTRGLDEAAGSEIAFNERLQALADTASGIGPEADRARRELVSMAEQGARGIQGITRSGEEAVQTLDDIKNAALEAKDALGNLADDYEKQILQIRGDKKTLEQLDYEDQLRKLEELRQKSGQEGQREFEEAKARAEQLHNLKLKQIADEERAKTKQQVEQPGATSQPSGATGQPAPSGGAISAGTTIGKIEVNIHSPYANMSDSQTWDAITRNKIKPALDGIARRTK